MTVQDRVLVDLSERISATLLSASLLADPVRFYELVSMSMSALDLRDVDMADRLPVSRSTVNRWRHGYSAPLPMARKMIYKVLLRRIAEKLDAQAKQEGFAGTTPAK